MTPEEIKNLLTREMENKKVHTAFTDTVCNENPSHHILEGDEFYFIGGKHKVCNDCFGDVMNFLDE